MFTHIPLTKEDYLKMSRLRIAINGFGRIGRTFTRVAQNYPEIEIIAINDLAEAPNLAHLLKYDSVHGRFNGVVDSLQNEIIIDGTPVKVFNEKDPSRLPWREMKIDYVIEATGHFKSRKQAQKRERRSQTPQQQILSKAKPGLTKHVNLSESARFG